MFTQNLATQAILSVMGGKKSFCKFLSANDTGKTGGHQAGIYIAKPAVPIIFDQAFEKGQNHDRWVNIEWQDGKTTETRFIYYGQGTRNEYRITNFGRDFEFLRTEYTGSLFVLIKYTEEEYRAFVLDNADLIDQFLDAFGMGPAQTNNLIETGDITFENREKAAIEKFITNLGSDAKFPETRVMAEAARRIQGEVYDHDEYIMENPDRKLIDWTDEEYRLFKAVEHAFEWPAIANGFNSIDEFIKVANTLLNRRKSRAGKSLEHHLAALFSGNEIAFESQVVTEGNKTPDFIFPSGIAYHNPSFTTSKLTSLAAKTTCKDRWRQILNEADRLRGETKYLCTLQQGISAKQMEEMTAEKVRLVVPRPYIRTYPAEWQEQIWSIDTFIKYVKEKESE